MTDLGTVSEMDTTAFRTLMAGFPSGVVIVTTVTGDGTPMGLTCSSLCSVSMDPPLLLVCIHNDSRTLKVLKASGSFAVNLLHARGQRAARLFAGNGPDRFHSVTWVPSRVSGVPCLIEDAHAMAECRLRSAVVAGDHTVVIGAVTAIRTLTAAPPLLYGLRRYAEWPGETNDETEDPNR